MLSRSVLDLIFWGLWAQNTKFHGDLLYCRDINKPPTITTKPSVLLFGAAAQDCVHYRLIWRSFIHFVHKTVEKNEEFILQNEGDILKRLALLSPPPQKKKFILIHATKRAEIFQIQKLEPGTV